MKSRIETLSILKDFYKITGARISIHDTYMKEIYCYPKALSFFCDKLQKNGDMRDRCVSADKAAFEVVKKTGVPYTYRCHCGLTETVAPIFHYGVLSGFFMMGQFTDDTTDSISNIEKLSERYFDDKKLLKEATESIPRCDRELIGSYLNILAVIAEYMTETELIAPRFSSLAENIFHYINANFSNDLSVRHLCGIFGCSRTTLMNSFRDRYGVTLGSYITKYRLQKASESLENSSSIKAAAINSGFKDQNYFTKVFVKHFSVTPSKYSKSKREGQDKL